jgi:hypothetical protein
LLPRRGTLAGSPRAIHWGWCPHRILAHWSEPESARETSRHGCSGRKPVDPTGSATSCALGRHRCHGAACARGRRCGVSDCRGCCRRSRPVVEPRWCSRRHGWARVDSGPPMPRPRLPPLAPVGEEEVDSDRGQMASSSPALRALSRGGAFRLLCCRSLE